jgi:hypothetical protein
VAEHAAAHTVANGNSQTVGMENARGVFQVAFAINHIAAQMAAGTPLAGEERDLLNGLYPLENGKWRYDPYHFDGLMNVDLLYSWKKWEDKEAELTALALRLVCRNPAAGLRHILTSAGYLWSVTGPTDPEHYYTVAFMSGGKYQKVRDISTSGPDNADWVEPTVPLPGFVEWTFRNTWLFWRPAIYLYAILFAVAIAMIREGSWRYAAFLIPIALQTGCLSIAALSHEFRFQFPVYMIALLYGGYFLFCSPANQITSLGDLGEARTLSSAASLSE